MLNDLRCALENSEYGYIDDSILEEGAKTKEMDEIVNGYTSTLNELNDKIKKAVDDKDYKSAEKYIFKKKKVLDIIRKAVRNVEITTSDSFKGKFAFGLCPIPSALRMGTWVKTLSGDEKHAKEVKVGTAKIYAMLGCFAPAAIMAAHTAGIQRNLKDKIKDGKVHPSKTNLLNCIDDADELLDKQLKEIRNRQRAKKESFTADSLFEDMVYTYMDTVLEGEDCEDCEDDIDDELEEFSLDIDMDDEF